jgi:succinate dehydrogenase / fumarate reductase flavoprotein subunit
MQVLPKFLSENADGSGRTEFLNGYFSERNEMLSRIFLKGYEWPFDVSKAAAGSSVIDLLVYREISAGKKVYLDFTANPGNTEIDFDRLSPEAGEYLRKAGACFGTPVERLIKMNEPAYEFYKGRGVNLKTTPLEISLSAQHNNGGLSVDLWWRTGVEGLFAAGEAAGTHGVKRPGGSALNAGQVGSLRAAQYIAACRKEMPEQERYGSEGTGEKLLAEAVRETEEIINAVIRQDGSAEKGEAESGKADSGEIGSGKTEAAPAG